MTLLGRIMTTKTLPSDLLMTSLFWKTNQYVSTDWQELAGKPFPPSQISTPTPEASILFFHNILSSQQILSFSKRLYNTQLSSPIMDHIVHTPWTASTQLKCSSQKKSNTQMNVGTVSKKLHGEFGVHPKKEISFFFFSPQINLNFHFFASNIICRENTQQERNDDFLWWERKVFVQGNVHWQMYLPSTKKEISNFFAPHKKLAPLFVDEQKQLHKIHVVTRTVSPLHCHPWLVQHSMNSKVRVVLLLPFYMRAGLVSRLALYMFALFKRCSRAKGLYRSSFTKNSRTADKLRFPRALIYSKDLRSKKVASRKRIILNFHPRPFS